MVEHWISFTLKDQISTMYFIEQINFPFLCNQPNQIVAHLELSFYLIVGFSLTGYVECPSWVFLAKNNVDQVLAYQLYH